MKSMYKILEDYGQSNISPFHMPGHKRNSSIMPDWNLWKMDFTEVEGLDNLHCAESIIKDAQKRLAKAYGVRASYFMVNGSTGGILAAISACVKHGDSIVIARNCHKSVYNALYLNELKPVYVYPEVVKDWEISGGVSPAEVELAIHSNPEVKAVVITSPTYEGIVSDVRAIADIAHAHGIPLIVDEAHGAHLKLMDNCPKSAVECGADLVIQSFHKLLPALTQTAVLHFNSKIADRGRLKNYLGIYQTSSPSYLFMASIDWALEFMQSEKEKLLEAEYWELLKSLKEKIGSLKYLRVADDKIAHQEDIAGVDLTKLVISSTVSEVSGALLEEKLLEEYQIQAEMSRGRNVLLMTSVADDAKEFDRLFEALKGLDEWIGNVEQKAERETASEESILKYRADVVLTCYDAVNAEQIRIPVEETVGKISAEYVYLYPPGIPLLVPGELITEELYRIIMYYRTKYIMEGESSQQRLQGMQDKNLNTFLVVDNYEEK